MAMAACLRATLAARRESSALRMIGRQFLRQVHGLSFGLQTLLLRQKLIHEGGASSSEAPALMAALIQSCLLIGQHSL